MALAQQQAHLGALDCPRGAAGRAQGEPQMAGLVDPGGAVFGRCFAAVLLGAVARFLRRIRPSDSVDRDVFDRLGNRLACGPLFQQTKPTADFLFGPGRDAGRRGFLPIWAILVSGVDLRTPPWRSASGASVACRWWHR